MSAQYLIRFDDICPTMNWNMWSRIEKVLINLGIAPILAVIPDNHDQKLMIASSNPGFWESVRRWQANGWSIGLHGHQHLYLNREGGILGFSRKSEFAGLAADRQENKLCKAVDIFVREEVVPELWIAPSHSFDESTITILANLGIRTISDGFALAPYIDERRMLWIPQQLWNFRWRPYGVWTVCYHHNLWGEADFIRFCRHIERYRQAITSVRNVKSRYSTRQYRFLDRVYSNVHLSILAAKSLII